MECVYLGWMVGGCVYICMCGTDSGHVMRASGGYLWRRPAIFCNTMIRDNVRLILEARVLLSKLSSPKGRKTRQAQPSSGSASSSEDASSIAAFPSASPADPIAVSRFVAGIPIEVRYNNCELLQLSIDVKKVWNLATDVLDQQSPHKQECHIFEPLLIIPLLLAEDPLINLPLLELLHLLLILGERDLLPTELAHKTLVVRVEDRSFEQQA